MHPMKRFPFAPAVCVAAVFLSATAASAALPGPESVAFAKGAKFAVAGYTGGETLTNFPVLVRISDNAPA